MLISCSQKVNHANQEDKEKRTSDLLSFSCRHSFEPYLDLDSVLQTIPDTLGFIVSSEHETMDLRLREARMLEMQEWKKHYKNPLINWTKETSKSVIFEVEFFGGGIFEFVGEVKATPDSLFLYYCEIKNSRTSYQGNFHDARYFLTYEVKKNKARDRGVRVVYKNPLPGSE